jgi:hypothetical protein
MYEDLMDAKDKSALTKAFDSLEEPMCPTCLLRTPIDCKVEGCEWSRAKMLEKWIKFCKQPIVHSWAKLKRHHETFEVEICYVRTERSEDDPKVMESWDIDFNASLLRINGKEELDIHKDALQGTIKQAKNMIAQHLADGYVYCKSLYDESRGGALSKLKSRDRSPKRKKKSK